VANISPSPVEIVDAVVTSALVWVSEHFDEYAAELKLSSRQAALAKAIITANAYAAGDAVLKTDAAKEYLASRKGN
jgi:hypothetical protein